MKDRFRMEELNTEDKLEILSKAKKYISERVHRTICSSVAKAFEELFQPDTLPSVADIFCFQIPELEDLRQKKLPKSRYDADYWFGDPSCDLNKKNRIDFLKNARDSVKGYRCGELTPQQKQRFISHYIKRNISSKKKRHSTELEAVWCLLDCLSKEELDDLPNIMRDESCNPDLRYRTLSKNLIPELQEFEREQHSSFYCFLIKLGLDNDALTMDIKSKENGDILEAHIVPRVGIEKIEHSAKIVSSDSEFKDVEEYDRPDKKKGELDRDTKIFLVRDIINDLFKRRKKDSKDISFDESLCSNSSRMFPGNPETKELDYNWRVLVPEILQLMNLMKVDLTHIRYASSPYSKVFLYQLEEAVKLGGVDKKEDFERELPIHKKVSIISDAIYHCTYDAAKMCKALRDSFENKGIHWQPDQMKYSTVFPELFNQMIESGIWANCQGAHGWTCTDRIKFLSKVLDDLAKQQKEVDEC